MKFFTALMPYFPYTIFDFFRAKDEYKLEPILFSKPYQKMFEENLQYLTFFTIFNLKSKKINK